MSSGNHMVDQGEPKDMSLCTCGGSYESITYCPEYGAECASQCNKLDDDIPDCKHAEDRLKCKVCGSIVEAR